MKAWQRRELHRLITACGIEKEQKEDLVFQFTGMRYTSSKELTDDQAMGLIRFLRKMDPCNKMRRKILSMAHEMGWELENGKVDIERVNAWTKKYGRWHLPLNDHDKNQLAYLVTQFQEGPYKSYLNSVYS